MTKYLISFPSSAMDHIPAEEFPAVADAAHAVVREAKRAGVWVFGGGINEQVPALMVGVMAVLPQKHILKPKFLMAVFQY